MVGLELVIDNRGVEHEPVFSVIVALFNAEDTLESTLESFDAQTIKSSAIEYIIVDDGSEDNSLPIAQRWARGRKNVVLVTKPNGGIASTRNEALRRARGAWITSVDPDDIVDRNYFLEVFNLIDLDKEGRVAILSTRVLPTKHESGKFNNRHPLDAKFRSGNRLLDLRLEPNAFAIGATSFLQRKVLAQENLTFDERVTPSFEDGNLILRYLTHFDEPVLGVVASAHYYYRKVSGGSSAVQGGWARPEKYLDQVEWGYLGALRYAMKRLGSIPDWLALAICYDLMYYFKEFNKFSSKTRWAGDAFGHKFMFLCREIFGYVSINQLRLLERNAPNWNLLQALRTGFETDGAPGRIFKWSKQPDGNVNYTVMLRPGKQKVELYSRGVPVVPRIEGKKKHSYFGETLAYEVSFKLPTGDVALFVDGVPCPEGAGASAERAVLMVEGEEWLNAMTRSARAKSFPWNKEQRVRERVWVESRILRVSPLRVLSGKAQSRLSRSKARSLGADQALREKVAHIANTEEGKRYNGGWLFVDHPERADDNAEHLFRHVMNSHPQINAYFLLERTSKDWDRLAAEGFQLLEYGSPHAMCAALAAAVVLSSDAVEACMYPAPRRLFGTPDYAFVFLQHGVSEKDISAWLRGKRISLTICSTVDEFSAFAWKDSPYEFKVDDVALTGFPRHDSLLQKAENKVALASVGSDRKRLLIVPTWRRDLKVSLDSAATPEDARRVFLDSEFGQAWWGVLEDPGIQGELQAGRLAIDFLLHPNFTAGVSGLVAPEGVNLVRVGEKPFQDMLVECDFFLTDYSSLAFDVAYIGRPVGYFQFDRDSLGSGSHSWVPGYFDYGRMGLGPTFDERSRVSEWVISSIQSGCKTPEKYEDRIRRTFIDRDKGNSRRVVQAVQALLAGTWPDTRPDLPLAAAPPLLGD